MTDRSDNLMIPPPGATLPSDTPAVSRLAAKVAHELNNPLDAVLRFVSLAQRKAKNGNYSDVDRHLADAQFGLERMTEILRELMDLGRQANEISSPRHNLFPLADLLAQAGRGIAPRAEEKSVTLHFHNQLTPDVAPNYDLRLIQILDNLLKNAVDAAPNGTTVILGVSSNPPLGESSGSLTITVQDNGPGVPEPLLSALFTPFITTKPSGAGHGLGLAISRELAISLGGSLTLANRPAPTTGCVATLTLPLDH